MRTLVVLTAVLLLVASVTWADGLMVEGADEVVISQPPPVVLAPAPVVLAPAVAKALAPVTLTGPDLSEMISATRTLTGKCAPINGESAYRLDAPIQAQVYFKTKGWVSGYIRAKDMVYATSCGDGWYNITRMVRCGNPARGKFRVCEKVRVEVRTEVQERTVIQKVEIPMQLPPLGPLPPVCPSKPIELTPVTIELLEVPVYPVTPCEPLTLTPVSLELIDIPVCPVTPSKPIELTPICYGPRDVRRVVEQTTYITTAAQPPCARPMEAFATGAPGSSEEHQIGAFAFGWENNDQPENPNCPPGGDPAVEPPPNGGGTNQPANQAGHGTNGEVWDPRPDSPHVADPVN